MPGRCQWSRGPFQQGRGLQRGPGLGAPTGALAEPSERGPQGSLSFPAPPSSSAARRERSKQHGYGAARVLTDETQKEAANVTAMSRCLKPSARKWRWMLPREPGATLLGFQVACSGHATTLVRAFQLAGTQCSVHGRGTQTSPVHGTPGIEAVWTDSQTTDHRHYSSLSRSSSVRALGREALPCFTGAFWPGWHQNSPTEREKATEVPTRDSEGQP